MRMFPRLALVAVLLLACVGCDQVSKSLVREHIALGESQSFAGDTFRLTHAENPGAFLSIGASLPEAARVAVFRVGVSLLVVGLLGYALFARGLGAWGVVGLRCSPRAAWATSSIGGCATASSRTFSIWGWVPSAPVFSMWPT